MLLETLARAVERRGQPRDLGLARLDLAGRRADLPRQPRQPLAAVRGGAHRGGQSALLGVEGLLGLGAVRDRALEHGAVALDRLRELGLLRPDLRGLGLHLLGLARARRGGLLVLGREVAHPLRRQRRRAGTRSRSADSRKNASCAWASTGADSRASASSAASRSRASASARSTIARRSRSAVSSATSAWSVEVNST